MKNYKQFYTSSLFNIENIIDYGLETTFVNVLTEEDLEVFNKIGVKQVIYNIDSLFFKHLDVVNKIIQSDIPIYSDNIKIRRYLFKNNSKPHYIEKQYDMFTLNNINFNQLSIINKNIGQYSLT
jgi:hypothetical protein